MTPPRRFAAADAKLLEQRVVGQPRQRPERDLAPGIDLGRTAGTEGEQAVRELSGARDDRALIAPVDDRARGPAGVGDEREQDADAEEHETGPETTGEARDLARQGESPGSPRRRVLGHRGVLRRGCARSFYERALCLPEAARAMHPMNMGFARTVARIAARGPRPGHPIRFDFVRGWNGREAFSRPPARACSRPGWRGARTSWQATSFVIAEPESFTTTPPPGSPSRTFVSMRVPSSRTATPFRGARADTGQPHCIDASTSSALSWKGAGAALRPKTEAGSATTGSAGRSKWKFVTAW